MAFPSLTTVALGEDLAAALQELPALPGVARILGAGGRELLVGRSASLRRWAASHLGAGRPPRKGKRPPTDLRPVAAAIDYLTTTSGFRQRLVFERLMADVPREKRRDLKPPAHLHLDPAERFPRVTVRVHAPGSRAGLYGPFRGRAAAEAAVKALHKLFPLRPCDYVFEPHPELPLGLGCVYAQVRTCAAPCLVRATEAAYRRLAAEATTFLGRPAARPPEVETWIPAWVAALDGARALVVEPGTAGLELYPVRDGAVLDERAVTVDAVSIDAALDGLSWAPPEPPRDDLPWLASWIYARRRTGAYLVASDDAGPALSGRVRDALRIGVHAG